MFFCGEPPLIGDFTAGARPLLRPAEKENVNDLQLNLFLISDDIGDSTLTRAGLLERRVGASERRRRAECFPTRHCSLITSDILRR
jgi:hypothetical protein